MANTHAQVNQHVLAHGVRDDFGQNFPAVKESVPFCYARAKSLEPFQTRLNIHTEMVIQAAIAGDFKLST